MHRPKGFCVRGGNKYMSLRCVVNVTMVGKDLISIANLCKCEYRYLRISVRMFSLAASIICHALRVTLDRRIRLFWILFHTHVSACPKGVIFFSN